MGELGLGGAVSCGGVDWWWRGKGSMVSLRDGLALGKSSARHLHVFASVSIIWCGKLG